MMRLVRLHAQGIDRQAAISLGVSRSHVDYDNRRLWLDIEQGLTDGSYTHDILRPMLVGRLPHLQVFPSEFLTQSRGHCERVGEMNTSNMCVSCSSHLISSMEASNVES